MKNLLICMIILSCGWAEDLSQPQVRYQEDRFLDSLAMRSYGIGLLCGSTIQLGTAIPLAVSDDYSRSGKAILASSSMPLSAALGLIISAKLRRERSLKHFDVNSNYIKGNKYRFAVQERFRGVLFLLAGFTDILVRSFAPSPSFQAGMTRSGLHYLPSVFSIGVSSLIMGIYHVRKFRKYSSLPISDDP